jgi:putative ABC transport system substrate-binding protein
MAKKMHKELKKKNLSGTNFTASEESDMQAIVELACRESDAIITPTDNAVASTISLIAKITLKYKTPLIVSDNMLVKYGALAARGVDYKVGGAQTAKIAYDVIVNGKQPHEIPVQQINNKKIFINKETLEALKLNIPKELKTDIVLI